MLKKTLKKILALSLATVTLVTSAMPVSAETLKPKKSHTKAEITEYVDYFNGITDAYTFRPAPESYVPVFADGDHTSYAYKAWQMTQLLQMTPGIDDEQKADMKKAASKWKKSYVSELMIVYYWEKWYDMFSYVDNLEGRNSSKYSASNFKARVKKTYTSVNSYITKKEKYNKKLASELKKFNKIRYNAWNTDINKWFSKSKKARQKYNDTHCDVYWGTALLKYHMNVESRTRGEFLSCRADGPVDEYYDKNIYAMDTLGLFGYYKVYDNPNTRFVNHTKYTKW